MIKYKYHRRLFYYGKKRTNLSEGKQNIISALLEEYDIQSADDIQDALKDLLGGTIQSMMEAEMDNHLGYEPYERTSNSNARNGRKSKTIRSKYGAMDIQVPQDRESSFEPKVVQKRQKISLISMIKLFQCMPKAYLQDKYQSRLKISMALM